MKRCSYVGTSLYRFLVPSSFGWRARLDVDTSHVFPQGSLTAITLEGGGVGAGGARTGAGCEAGPPLCSVAITALSGAGSDAKLLRQKPGGLSSSWFCSLYVCTFPYPSTGTLAPERSRAEARGARAMLVGGRDPSCLLCWCQQLLPLPCSDTTSGSSPLCSSQPITTPASTNPTLLWSHKTGQVGSAWVLSMYLRSRCGGAASVRIPGYY